MATKEKIDAAALSAALETIKGALAAKGGDFSQKAEASLDLLDASLGFFATEGALARASVEVQMQTRTGGCFRRKYTLAVKKDSFGEESTYLKKSELEEYE